MTQNRVRHKWQTPTKHGRNARVSKKHRAKQRAKAADQAYKAWLKRVAQEWAELPTEDVDHWLIGWKQAYLLISPDYRTVRFGGISGNGCDYQVVDEALCGRRARGNSDHGVATTDHNHGCGCGFWASKYEPIGTSSEREKVLLRVGLRGNYIEAESGYRAQFQHVTNVFVAKRCNSCEAEAHYLTVRGNPSVWPGLQLVPVCAEHAAVKHDTVAFSLEAVSHMLGCPVVWDERG